MKKRVLFSVALLLLAFCLIFTSCAKKDEPQNEPDSSQSEDQTASKGLKYVSNGDGTCYVYGIGVCTDKEIVVPATSPAGDKVTAIGNGIINEESYSGFFMCQEIESVKLPDSVVNIAEGAFAGCDSLKTIVLSNNVTSIGDSAFYGCSALEAIVIPDGVTSIGETTFYGCSALKTIVLSNSLTDIGSFAFYGCISLEAIEIPSGVTSLGVGVFHDCHSLQNVTIPGSVSILPAGAFYYCIALHSVTLSEGVTKIDQYAFAYCSVLESVAIPESLTSIEQCAFLDCPILTGITLPKNLSSIGTAAFANCDSLTEMTYLGTLDEWDAITKSEDWDTSTERYRILCMDGEFEKNLVEVVVPVADGLYTAADSSSDYVKINVSFTDANGEARTGDIVIELRPDCAPKTVANFKKLVSEGYYSGTEFARIIEGFMIQCVADSQKAADCIEGEFSLAGVDNPLKHERGVISMARRGDNEDGSPVTYGDGIVSYHSASSGFFIMHEDASNLDGVYAAFGCVVFGIENVDNIAEQPVVYSPTYGDYVAPKNPVTVNSITFVTPVA